MRPKSNPAVRQTWVRETPTGTRILHWTMFADVDAGESDDVEHWVVTDNWTGKAYLVRPIGFDGSRSIGILLDVKLCK